VTERNELPDLQRGEGLWRVGQRAFVVRHLVTDGELQLFDTNSRMLNIVSKCTPKPLFRPASG